jgi:putative membrane protein
LLILNAEPQGIVMNIRRLLALSLVCSCGAVALTQVVSATEQEDDPARTGEADRSSMKVTGPEFVKKAGAAGMAEVDMGKLGSKKAANAEVKAYAQRMVTDHTKANKELTAAAEGKGTAVPSSPDMMHKAMMEKFEHQASDKDFDHDFMQQMVKDHKAVVDLFASAANDSSIDPEFRALAKKTLPVLQEHLKDAQALERKLAK